MKRVQLFEFEDFSWFPTTFRSTMTKIIVVFHKIFNTKEVIGKLIKEVREKHEFDRIVDMGAGSGGAMPMVIEHYNSENQNKVDLLLTDLHPNSNFVTKFNAENRTNMTYHSESLDATNLANAPEGLKTMMNSFHHMTPEMSRKILKSAQENKQPILIYEMGENVIPLPIWWLLLPISLPLVALTAILFLPFIKPLNFKDILFTWLIPIIPILYAWDGQASAPRTYTFSDIEELKPEQDDEYFWEVKHARNNKGKKLGYYIMGYPQ